MPLPVTTNYGLPAPAAGQPAADYDSEFATQMTAADAAIAAAIRKSPPLDKSTNYSIVAADAGKTLRATAALTFTIAQNTLAVGEFVNLQSATTGTVTVAQGTGATLVSRGSAFNLAGQWALATLYCDATNHFVLTGDIA